MSETVPSLPGTRILTAGLETALCSAGFPARRLTVLRRKQVLTPMPFPAEIVDCLLEDGSEFRIRCKYRAGVQPDSPGRRGGRGHEAVLYLRILEPACCPTPAVFGTMTDAESGERWLILGETHPGTTLVDPPAKLAPPTRWIGPFRARGQETVDREASRSLTRYDRSLGSRIGEWVEDVSGTMQDRFGWLPLGRRPEPLLASLLHADRTILHRQSPRTIDLHALPAATRGAPILEGHVQDSAGSRRPWSPPAGFEARRELANLSLRPPRLFAPRTTRIDGEVLRRLVAILTTDDRPRTMEETGATGTNGSAVARSSVSKAGASSTGGPHVPVEAPTVGGAELARATLRATVSESEHKPSTISSKEAQELAKSQPSTGGRAAGGAVGAPAKRSSRAIPIAALPALPGGQKAEAPEAPESPSGIAQAGRAAAPLSAPRPRPEAAASTSARGSRRAPGGSRHGGALEPHERAPGAAPEEVGRDELPGPQGESGVDGAGVSVSKPRVRLPVWAKRLALLGLAAGALGYGLLRLQGLPGPLPDYRFARVKKGTLTQVVTTSGQLNPVVRVEVGSQISGTLRRVYVDFDSKVTAWQSLAQIDPSTYEAELAQAKGGLANAEAAFELARVSLQRAKAQQAEGLISQSDIDKMGADLKQAESNVEIDRATVQKAQLEVDRCTIRTPIDGIVIARNVNPGQTVAASFSAPTLFVIANDLTKMQIVANVSEADIGSVREGQEVEFTVDAFPKETFHGRVEHIRSAPAAEQNVVTYQTLIVVDPESRLRPGMTANALIVLARDEDALTVPNAALRFVPAAEAGTGAAHPDSTAASAGGATGASPGASEDKHRKRGKESSERTVYVPCGPSAAGRREPAGAACPVEIKTGLTDGRSTEVLEGLEEGAQVIVGAGAPQERTPDLFRRMKEWLGRK